MISVLQSNYMCGLAGDLQQCNIYNFFTTSIQLLYQNKLQAFKTVTQINTTSTLFTLNYLQYLNNVLDH